MKARRYKTDIYINLNPPNVFKDIGKHRVVLIKTILLDFVPYPGLCLRFVGKYPEQERENWSSLMRLASGPKGAVGLGFNNEIWPLDAVFYDAATNRLEASCQPEMLTLEQLYAVEELLSNYQGFRLLYPSLRSRHRLPLS